MGEIISDNLWIEIDLQDHKNGTLISKDTYT